MLVLAVAPSVGNSLEPSWLTTAPRVGDEAVALAAPHVLGGHCLWRWGGLLDHCLLRVGLLRLPERHLLAPASGARWHQRNRWIQAAVFAPHTGKRNRLRPGCFPRGNLSEGHHLTPWKKPQSKRRTTFKRQRGRWQWGGVFMAVGVAGSYNTGQTTALAAPRAKALCCVLNATRRHCTEATLLSEAAPHRIHGCSSS